MPSRCEQHPTHLMEEVSEEGKSHLMGSYRVPSTAPGAVHSLANLVLPIIPSGGRYRCPHFAGEETKGLRGERSCPAQRYTQVVNGKAGVPPGQDVPRPANFGLRDQQVSPCPKSLHKAVKLEIP